MRVLLFNGNRLQKMVLPKKMEGSFWLVDELNNNNNIINIESINDKWVMKNNEDTKIIFGNSYVETVELKPNYFYFLEYNKKRVLLYVEKILDETIKYYKLEKNTSITIGKDNSNDIYYENSYITNNYVKLTNGDYLEMASDGLASLDKSLESILLDCEHEDLRVYARNILKKSSLSSEGIADDDSTVIVAKIYNSQE